MHQEYRTTEEINLNSLSESPNLIRRPCYPDLERIASMEFDITWLGRLLKSDPDIRKLEIDALVDDYNSARFVRGERRILKPSHINLSDLLLKSNSCSSPQLVRSLQVLNDLKLVLISLNNASGPVLQHQLDDISLNLSQVRAALSIRHELTLRNGWASMKLEGEVAEANQNIDLAPANCQVPWVKNHRSLPRNRRRFAILAISNNMNCETNQKRLVSTLIPSVVSVMRAKVPPDMSSTVAPKDFTSTVNATMQQWHLSPAP